MADWIGVLGTPLDVSGGILTIQLSQVLSFGADITCILRGTAQDVPGLRPTTEIWASPESFD